MKIVWSMVITKQTHSLFNGRLMMVFYMYFKTNMWLSIRILFGQGGSTNHTFNRNQYSLVYHIDTPIFQKKISCMCNCTSALENGRSGFQLPDRKLGIGRISIDYPLCRTRTGFKKRKFTAVINWNYRKIEINPYFWDTQVSKWLCWIFKIFYSLKTCLILMMFISNLSLID